MNLTRAYYQQPTIIIITAESNAFEAEKLSPDGRLTWKIRLCFIIGHIYGKKYKQWGFICGWINTKYPKKFRHYMKILYITYSEFSLNVLSCMTEEKTFPLLSPWFLKVEVLYKQSLQEQTSPIFSFRLLSSTFSLFVKKYKQNNLMLEHIFICVLWENSFISFLWNSFLYKYRLSVVSNFPLSISFHSLFYCQRGNSILFSMLCSH